MPMILQYHCWVAAYRSASLVSCFFSSGSGECVKPMTAPPSTRIVHITTGERGYGVISETYVTKADAARLLNVNTLTIYLWIKKGKLKTEKVGRELLILKADLSGVTKSPAGESPRTKSELVSLTQGKVCDIMATWQRNAQESHSLVIIGGLLSRRPSPFWNGGKA